MGAEHDKDSRDKIKQIYFKAAGLLERMQDSERLAELAPVYNRVEMGIFRLVVMGEIKKGKSSFINALLAEPDLLPTASDVATSTVFKILYGPARKTKVFFLPDVDTGKRPDVLEVPPEKVGDYGTEAGNPGNVKRVDFIGVELPNPMLKSGLVIVDTPGVGGLFKEHRDITLRYAPNADAVFFVLDSVESVISQDEVLFLKELSRISSRRIVFVQSKIDAADEESWKSWQERNQGIIADKLGIPQDKQLYFPVSAKLKGMADRRKSGKHLDRSGYLSLLNYLNHSLIPRKETALAKDAASVFQACLMEIAAVQQRSVQVLQQNSREALTDMQQRLVEKKKQMIEWRSTTYHSEIQSFNNLFQDLRRNTRNRLQNELEPTSTGSLVASCMNNLRNDPELDADSIEARVQEFQNDVLVEASTLASNAFGDFTDSFDSALKATAEKLGDSVVSMESGNTSFPDEGLSTSLVGSLNMSKSSYESGRNLFMGGAIGLGAVKALYFVAPHIALLADLATYAVVGGIAAGVFGARSSEKKHKRNEALQRLERILQELVQKILRHSTVRFDDMCVKLEREASSLFNKIADRMQKDIEKEIREVQEAAVASKEEAAIKLKENTALLQDTSKVLADVELLLKG